MPGRNRRFSVFFLLVWSYLVLYPQPSALGASIYRLFRPPVEAEAVTPLMAGLPGGAGPSELEKYILDTFPYYHDWQVYGYPWYFPTAAEAVQQGKGDCKTRFIVLASLFTALQVPYELFISPTHIWINYAGKKETNQENRQAALYQKDKEKTLIKLPHIDWAAGAKITGEAFWVYMPRQRKLLLLSGPILSLFIFLFPTKTRLHPRR